MNLFEINGKIRRFLDNIEVDPETGEVTGIEELENLEIERNDKINNTAMYYLSLLSDAEAYEKQKKKFAEWEARTKKKAELIKNYLSENLGGEKFKSDTVQISFRRSESVETDKDFAIWAETFAPQYLTYKAPEINKNVLKSALKAGNNIIGARLVEKNNIQIK